MSHATSVNALPADGKPRPGESALRHPRPKGDRVDAGAFAGALWPAHRAARGRCRRGTLRALMKILVLGGGQQGRVIASDLARSLPDARVVVGDLRAPQLPALPNLSWQELDLADPTVLARAMAAHDLNVGALPSRLGFAVLSAAVEARRPLVDVSFCAEDPLTLDAAARAAGVTVVPDAGLAPGLSHLMCGHAVARGPVDELTIYVGGVAQDRSRPYGYVVTWSLEDLLEEYVRPARIVRDGAAVSVPVFSELETLTVDGAGDMEAFLSDGLRTLVDTLPQVPHMEEKTLRWPGHVAAVRPLVERGVFLDEFRARCVEDRPQDLVALVVRVRRGDRTSVMTMTDRADPGHGPDRHGPHHRAHHLGHRAARGARRGEGHRRAPAGARGRRPRGLQLHRARHGRAGGPPALERRVSAAFDLVVVGAGSGGIAGAIRAARHGARVAVCDPGALGGTCVNVGCVPKKAMWLAAELAEAQHLAAEVGFAVTPGALDWGAFITRRERYITNIHASYRRRFDELGITLLPSRATLLDAGTVRAGDHTLRAPRVLLATGAHPRRLGISGQSLGADSDGFFALREAPKRVAIIGGGYIAVELAGVLRALGAEVVLFVRGERLLNAFDADLADALLAAMRRRGIEVILRHELDDVRRAGESLEVHCQSGERVGGFDRVLWAIGRAPNTAGLGLDAAGVALDEQGFVKVDAWQQTSAPGVFAVGDVTSAPALTPGGHRGLAPAHGPPLRGED